MTDLAERRTRETERSAGHLLPDTFTLKVVGVSFTAHYPENLHTLARLFNTGAHTCYPVTLHRARDNAYDRNAIAVHILSLIHI